MYNCTLCESSFNNKQTLDIHQSMIHNIVPEYLCKKCGKVFMIESNRRRHELKCELYKCTKCKHEFQNQYAASRHEEVCGEEPQYKKAKKEPSKNNLLAMPHDNNGLSEYETAFENRLKSYFLRCDECQDINSFLQKSKDLIVSVLRNQLSEHKSIKMNLLIECLFSNTHEENCDRAFKTANQIILEDSNLDLVLESAFKKLSTEMEESQLKNSGWALVGIDGLRLRINKYNPLRASTFIPLPSAIANRGACINVKNSDNKCFAYSILAKFCDQDPQRMAKYSKLMDKYDFSSVAFPTPLDDIKKFENLNNISINVYGVTKNDQIYVLKITDVEKHDHRDLLLINHNNEKAHYVYIKNFNKLVASQISRHEHNISVCRRCLTHFNNNYGKTSQSKLEEHMIWCRKNRPVRVEMPTKKPFVEFENVERIMRVPFVIYCDFESILIPVEGCRPNYEESYSTRYQQHEVMSYCAYLKQTDEVAEMDLSLPTEPIIYRGPDAQKHLIAYLRDIAEKISVIYKINKSMTPLTDEDLRAFESSQTCFMCSKVFDTNDIKVRDHCHITGKFRGAAHNGCNLKYQSPNFLPILFHNLSGYDSHFIIKELGYDDKQIDVIPNTEEKYISFTKTINKDMKLRFLDTFRFMPASLSDLVKNLSKLREVSKFYDTRDSALLTRKGVFPYDYVTSWDKLEEPCLPAKEYFYNNLNLCHITEDDYDHACNVWNTFDF